MEGQVQKPGHKWRECVPNGVVFLGRGLIFPLFGSGLQHSCRCARCLVRNANDWPAAAETRDYTGQELKSRGLNPDCSVCLVLCFIFFCVK